MIETHDKLEIEAKRDKNALEIFLIRRFCINLSIKRGLSNQTKCLSQLNCSLTVFIKCHENYLIDGKIFCLRLSLLTRHIQVGEVSKALPLQLQNFIFNQLYNMMR